MKYFDKQYNDIIKAELHCHLGGSIRTSTIIDIAKEYKLKLPSYEVGTLNQHVSYHSRTSLAARS